MEVPAESLATLYSLGFEPADVEAIALDRIRRRRPPSLDAFVECLYRDIDRTIENIEENAHLVQADLEDSLTSRVIGNLKMLGYLAISNPLERGHVDLLVRSHDDQFKWLGEAKCFTGGYDHLHEGFLQLQTRYSAGRRPLRARPGG